MDIISNFRKRTFSENKVNTGRQSELDIARTVVILMLASIHCIIEYSSQEALESGIPYLFDTIIGGPLAAPVFIFCMGVCIVYSHKNEPKDIIKRGIKLFLEGQLLNICRYTIPYLVGFAITGNSEKFIEPLLCRTFCNDILQYAGLSYIVIGLFIMFKLSENTMILISIVCSIVGSLFNDIDLNNNVANLILNYFIGIKDTSSMMEISFALFNWLIVAVFGYVFGTILIYTKDKKQLYKNISPFCIVFSSVYFLIGITNKRGMFGFGENCYYYISTLDVLASIMWVVGIFGVYNWLSNKIPKKLMAVIQDISKNVMSIYCIHWIFVVYIIDVFIYIKYGTEQINQGIVLCISFGITVVSIIIAHYWAILKKGINGKKGTPYEEAKVRN